MGNNEGWYPSEDEHKFRYWDGKRWLDNSAHPDFKLHQGIREIAATTRDQAGNPVKIIRRADEDGNDEIVTERLDKKGRPTIDIMTIKPNFRTDTSTTTRVLGGNAVMSSSKDGRVPGAPYSTKDKIIGYFFSLLMLSVVLYVLYGMISSYFF